MNEMYVDDNFKRFDFRVWEERIFILLAENPTKLSYFLETREVAFSKWRRRREKESYKKDRNSGSHLLVFCFNYSHQMPRPRGTRRFLGDSPTTVSDIDISRPEKNDEELESYV